ncbi:MAG: DNA polymerase III subunit alpha, partial [Oscillospiraceae bacterium]|nr:DNA polymerase III subunit alpha [Oscillospiraceae bacterium]
KFTVEGESVRFGLLAIKNLGGGFIRQIIAERELGGPFTGFYNFLKRMHDKDFNKRAAESLIKAGALDGLGSNRREMMMALGAFLGELEDGARRNVEGQIGFFDMLSSEQRQSAEPQVPRQAEYAHAELLAYEKETLGVYLSGHPLSKMSELAERLGSAKISDLLDPANETGQGPHGDNEDVRLLCVVAGVKKKIVKNDATMAFLTVEDLYGQMECLVFPSTLERYANVFAEGRTVLIAGRLSLQENKEAKLLCNSIEAMDDTPEAEQPGQKKKRRGVFLRFESRDDPRMARALQLLSIFDEGRLPVMLYCEDTKQYSKRPGVDWNPVLARELARLLGEGNVVANT